MTAELLLGILILSGMVGVSAILSGAIGNPLACALLDFRAPTPIDEMQRLATEQAEMYRSHAGLSHLPKSRPTSPEGVQ